MYDDDYVDTSWLRPRPRHTLPYSECRRRGHNWKIAWRFMWKLHANTPWRARRWHKCAGCGIVQMGKPIFRRRP